MAHTNAASSMPALIGSKKQVACAESIRRPVCEALAAVKADLVLDPGLSAKAERELRDGILLVVDEVCQQTEAQWWIDHRDRGELPAAISPWYWIACEVQRRGLARTALVESREILARRDSPDGGPAT